MAKKSYVSNAQAFSVGAQLKFPPFVDAVGPTGRRNVIDSIDVEVTYSLTPSTANMQGENMPNLFSQIEVLDAGGARRSFTGRAARLAAIRQDGPQYFPELADLATGAARTGEYRLPLIFNSRKSFNGKEFSIPAELLRQINLTCCASNGLDYGSGTVAIGTCTVTLRAHCHEEHQVRLKARDFIGEEVMRTTSESTHQVGPEGGFVDWIVAYKDGDALADISGWTAHRVLPMITENESFALKLHEYQRENGAANNGATPGGEIYNDPFLQATVKAINVFSAGWDAKLHDMHFAEAVTIRATNTLADAVILMRSVQPRNGALDRSILRSYGKSQAVVKSGPEGEANSKFLEKVAK